MAKKSQTKNSKMIVFGGGAIIVLGLLLVGTYGINLTTMVGRGGGIGAELGNQIESAECTAAKEYLKHTQNEFNRHCSAVIITFPFIPSEQCNEARIDVDDAEKNVEEVCSQPFQRPGDDENGVFQPPVVPPTVPLFATATPLPTTNPPAAARPGV